VGRCLDIFATYNCLKDQYGDQLKFFTKADLSYEQFSYFPQPLPDAYIRLKQGNEEKQFFLDLYYDNQPFFASARKVKRYIKYDEDANWSVTETDLPIVLAVCESASLVKHLQKHMAKAMNNAWADSEVTFTLTTKAQLTSSESAIWRLATEPDEIFSLDTIS
jgi:hypothetical protein